jgi:hypothetical protein
MRSRLPPGDFAMPTVPYDEAPGLVEQIVRSQTTGAAKRAFPDDECPPAVRLQCLDGQAITFLSTKDLRGPEFGSRLGDL